ncbi:MAG TPA: hypothetical protein PLQ35_14040 [bacterium]|nr:hypothetical protein [bacterium]HQL63406.1 hypothetical protein [bacterium]
MDGRHEGLSSLFPQLGRPGVPACRSATAPEDCPAIRPWWVLFHIYGRFVVGAAAYPATSTSQSARETAFSRAADLVRNPVEARDERVLGRLH